MREDSVLDDESKGKLPLAALAGLGECCIRRGENGREDVGENGRGDVGEVTAAAGGEVLP